MPSLMMYLLLNYSWINIMLHAIKARTSTNAAKFDFLFSLVYLFLDIKTKLKNRLWCIIIIECRITNNIFAVLKGLWLHYSWNRNINRSNKIEFDENLSILTNFYLLNYFCCIVLHTVFVFSTNVKQKCATYLFQITMPTHLILLLEMLNSKQSIISNPV